MHVLGVQQSQAGATTRKHATRVDRSYSGNHVDQDSSYDDDGTSRKYSKRGKCAWDPFRLWLEWCDAQLVRMS
jgi:hypothetical protein